MACLNPGGTEVPFRDALKNASRLTVAGDRLELLDAAGTRLAAFVAANQPSALAPSSGLAWSERRIGHCSWPENASHEMFECQFTNVPVGFSFHAHTCSV